MDGAPGRIRTRDHLVRSQVLYPTELLARTWTLLAKRTELYTHFLTFVKFFLNVLNVPSETCDESDEGYLCRTLTNLMGRLAALATLLASVAVRVVDTASGRLMPSLARNRKSNASIISAESWRISSTAFP